MRRVFVVALVFVTILLVVGAIIVPQRIESNHYFKNLDLEFVGKVTSIKEMGRRDIIRMKKEYSNVDCFEDRDFIFCKINSEEIELFGSASGVNVGDRIILNKQNEILLLVDDHDHVKGGLPKMVSSYYKWFIDDDIFEISCAFSSQSQRSFSTE